MARGLQKNADLLENKPKRQTVEPDESIWSMCMGVFFGRCMVCKSWLNLLPPLRLWITLFSLHRPPVTGTGHYIMKITSTSSFYSMLLHWIYFLNFPAFSIINVPCLSYSSILNSLLPFFLKDTPSTLRSACFLTFLSRSIWISTWWCQLPCPILSNLFIVQIPPWLFLSPIVKRWKALLFCLF